jgi:hypothetical protein
VSSRRRSEKHAMTEVRRSPQVSPMTHNVDMILDAHTHLTGSEEPEQNVSPRILGPRRSP